jgi:hypothetical protein
MHNLYPYGKKKMDEAAYLLLLFLYSICGPKSREIVTCIPHVI